MERIVIVRARLRRIEALEIAMKAKLTSLRSQRGFNGRDARRYVTLADALRRVDRLHPFHRMRTLP